MVRRVVAKRCRDPALCRHSVRTGREDLGDAGRLQTGFRRTHGGAQAGAARADNDGVIDVIDDFIFTGH